MPLSPIPIAYSVHAYPADDLILIRFSGEVDGDQLKAALIAQARAVSSAGTVGVWDALGVSRLDLPPNAFEHLVRSFARVVRLRRPGAQAIVATDTVLCSIAQLIRRHARRFGVRVEVVPTVNAVCQMLYLPHALSRANVTRAVSEDASSLRR